MRSVVEHFVSDWCWSGNLMDGRRGKVVCHLRIGGDLKKEMKQVCERSLRATDTKSCLYCFLIVTGIHYLRDIYQEPQTRRRKNLAWIDLQPEAKTNITTTI